MNVDTFKGTQRTFKRTQVNNGPIDKVFRLLCPVREKDWIDGWEYNLIHSESGYAEKDCVFTTPHHSQHKSVWHITIHDKINHHIELIRTTPGENTVRINIQLENIGQNQTKTEIQYMYTALSDYGNDFIENDMEQNFENSMNWWEKSINHYLETGEKLKK